MTALATRYASSAMLRTMQIDEAVAMKTVKMVFSVGREMKQSTRLGHGHWSHCTSRGIWKPSYTTYSAYLERGHTWHGHRQHGMTIPTNVVYRRKIIMMVLHEASFKQQPEHQAAGIRPPEGASYWESPSLQSFQLFLLAFVAEETSSARALSHRMT